MKKYKITAFILIFVFMLGVLVHANQDKPSDYLKAYCGSEVLSKVFENLAINHGKSDKLIKELNALADENRGINSFYEIKQTAQKAGLKTKALKTDLNVLRSLIKEGQLIANITGNRHFCLIEDVQEDRVTAYIPGLNHDKPTMPNSHFLETWDKLVLLVSHKNINLSKYKGNYELVKDGQLKNILGGQPCGNCSGGSGSYTGSGGDGRWTSGNESGESNSDSSTAPSDPSTNEPVIIRNGNLFLTVDDMSVPTRSLPLKLKRYYNAEIVSEVPGWLPEPGAGSWVIENGEYSGQGNRSTSDLKFRDFTLDLDMQTIQPGDHYAWEVARVNFRYTEYPTDPRRAKDAYYFLIHTNGKIELAKWQNGTQYFLYNKYTSYRPTNKNHIKIAAQASNIKIYINGVLEINYTDPSPILADGRVALEADFSHAHFDNIDITSGAQVYNYDFNIDDNEFIFGYGWTHSYSLRIKDYTNHVTLYRENNHKELYVPQGDGTYKSIPVNYYSNFTKDASGFSLKTKYGLHYRFDLNGRLQYIEDRNLNRTTVAYSTIGGKILLTSITEPSGRAITLQYGANNMVSKATDPQGNFIQYYYDSSGRLTRVIDRNGNETNYAYDPLTNNLVTLTDPEGNTYNYTYTYADRVNNQTDPLGNTTTFDYLWSVVHIINSRNQVYKYDFDNNEFLKTITDPANNIERTTNDANGNVTNHYDKNNNQTSYTYDTNGNRTGIYNAKGKWTRYTYETTYNLPTSFTDARGYVTTFSYDSKGNLVQTINPEGGVTINVYNSYGQIISTTAPEGNITYFTYDTYGNLATKTDALGNTTTYTYDVLGRLTRITDPEGNAREYTYDGNGNTLSVKDPLGNVTIYTYTGNDELVSITDPLYNTTTYTYDCFGNLLTVTDASGGIATYTYDTVNQMQLNKANLLSITDAKGNTTTYNYDSLDRLISITDAQNQIIQFNYDPQGNLTSRTDANANTTNYQYDVLNRLIRIDYPDLTYVSYDYDSVGNLTYMYDYSGGVARFYHDGLNRLTTYQHGGVNCYYTYDLNGNRTVLDIGGSIGDFGKILYDYDELNHLTAITTPDGKTAQFTYDNLSRRTQLNYPNGATTTYMYDNASRLIQLINKDKNAQDISRFIYTYDKASRRTMVDLINGSINYAYDKLNQLTEESGTINTESFSLGFTYDAVGNRLTLNDTGKTTHYTYNSLNQLIQSSNAPQKLIQVKGTVIDEEPVTVKVNGIDAMVSLDQFVANNVPLTPGLNTIEARATDTSGNIGTHQINVTYDTPSSITNYTYDANGNLTQRKVNTTTETLTYDYENRLIAYSSPTKSATYAYNGLGKRISKTVNGTTTTYYYDGNEVILEKTDSSSIYYIHSNRLDELISDSRGYSYHTDGLGSVANLTDSSGVSIATYDYKAFGSIRSQSGAVSNRWLFTGRELDSETGLYFYRNRYYDAGVGRFITRDPSLTLHANTNVIPYLLLNQLNNPLELQKYIYCVNNPTDLVDPWGLEGGGQGGNQWGRLSSWVNQHGSVDITFDAGTGIVGVSGQLSITDSGITGYVGVGTGIGFGISFTGGVSLGDNSGWSVVASASGGTGNVGGTVDIVLSGSGNSVNIGIGWGVGAGGSVTVGYGGNIWSWSQ